MPHFIAKSCDIEFPFCRNGFSFLEEFSLQRESVILVNSQNTEFLIRKVPHAKGWLFKAEKITRPSSTGLLKQALSLLASRCDVLSENLTISSERQKVQSPYLLDGEELLSEVVKYHWVLEIGFGSGRHLLNLAKNFPNQRFLGVEIHIPSLEQVHNQIKILGLKNLYLTKMDARILLNFLPSNSLDSIYLHFPVPWNKKPNRRVLTPSFLTQALRALKKDSFLHLRTDDEVYFSDALKLVLQNQNAQFHVRKNCDSSVISKYEARWRKQEKNIYDLEIYSLFAADEVDLQYDFSLPFFDKDFENLVGKKIINEDFFLHIPRLYRAKDSIMLPMSFGDFSWSNTKYLWMDSKRKITRFLGAPMLSVPANIKVHQTLIRLLGA